MLHELLTTHKTELVDRCRQKVARRSAPKKTPMELEHGVPLLIDQLISTLQSNVLDTRTDASGVASAASAEAGAKITEIRHSAALHGRELLKQGFTVDQVVHDYGDLCQAVTELALDIGRPIEVEDFRILNRCLDLAIAGAVTEYSAGHDSQIADHGIDALNQRQGFLAHEMRNLMSQATLAISVIKAGNVGLNGATGAILDHSLILMRDLIDRSLAEVRSTAGLPARRERISLADFIGEVSRTASLEARAADCHFTVAEVDPQLAVDADRDLLHSATSNLVQNAFKFTQPHSEVSLKAHARGDRILIEIADHCGGLAVGWQRATRKRSFYRSFSAARIAPAWGLACPSADTTSRQTTAFSAFVMFPESAAFLPLACLDSRCRRAQGQRRASPVGPFVLYGLFFLVVMGFAVRLGRQERSAAAPIAAS